MNHQELEGDSDSELCGLCEGTGYNVDGRWLNTILGLLMLAGSEGAKPILGIRDASIHPWLRALTLAPKSLLNPLAIDPPTREMAKLTAGLAGRTPSGMGHDAIDRGEARKKIVRAAGLPESWGLCARCEGAGYALSEEREQRHG